MWIFMNKKFYHDISYAHSATSGLGKSFIRILENTTVGLHYENDLKDGYPA